MKGFLYITLAILLTPIYIIIKIFTGFMKFMFEITECVQEMLQEAIETMVDFWKNIFKKQ